MTTPTGDSDSDALTALQRLEAALDERDDSQARAEALLEAAGSEAERILEAARADGKAAGDRHKAALLERAHTDVATAEAIARAEVERLEKRVHGERRRLAARLMGLVLGKEVSTRVGSDDTDSADRSADGS